jgi:hypothetical protein
MGSVTAAADDEDDMPALDAQDDSDDDAMPGLAPV